jgi:hypothetical protein
MNTESPLARLQRRHLRIGWGSLLVFVLLGGVLESLHGFKVDWYLAVGHETQRLLWRLAHAHGTFLSLLHIAFALSLPHMLRAEGEVPPKLSAAALTSALLALPGGFLLGAFGGAGGDPGVGIVLVPLGLVMLVVALIGMMRRLRT